jgi:UDP-glucose 4-epimerase
VSDSRKGARDLRGQRVVVIGGAGFIGSHVVELLTREDVREIVIYDDFARGRPGNLAVALRDPRVSVFDLGGDIRHTDLLAAALRGADCVVHLAALWLLHCEDYPRSAFEVNIRGTFNVLEACVAANVRRLVYSSSASVYGDAVDVPMSEEHPFNNRTFYGATKVAGEQMCRAFHARYGLDYVALRYMNVYGPRQDARGAYTSVIMKVLEAIDSGARPVIHGDGSQSYDFVYVEDVARANVLACAAAATDEAFNVGTGVPTSIKELVHQLLALTGATVTPEHRPQTRTFVSQRLGSTKKAERLLDFRAAVSLKEGLERLIAWRKDALASASR